MHRTTTTATLLATMALSAVSGCVTVQRAPAAVPPAPAQPSAPRTDGHTGPQIVQAPAREALQSTGPSRRPGTAAPGPRPAAQAPSPVQRVPSRHTESRPRSEAPRPEPRRPEPRRPRQQPPATVPAVSPTVGGTGDVCALGRKYGGWRPNSPEAAICEQTYGR
ncbi:hypothetical protein ACIHCM_12825 [Streptomyces sp. NPDC052023]|uniref:hypothetical protein n=1 Tax=Streptomyces sp. NPDC052023 TaxID=3365681 RepID=UPI0037D25C0D